MSGDDDEAGRAQGFEQPDRSLEEGRMQVCSRIVADDEGARRPELGQGDEAEEGRLTVGESRGRDGFGEAVEDELQLDVAKHGRWQVDVAGIATERKSSFFYDPLPGELITSGKLIETVCQVQALPFDAIDAVDGSGEPLQGRLGENRVGRTHDERTEGARTFHLVEFVRHMIEDMRCRTVAHQCMQRGRCVLFAPDIELLFEYDGVEADDHVFLVTSSSTNPWRHEPWRDGPPSITGHQCCRYEEARSM